MAVSEAGESKICAYVKEMGNSDLTARTDSGRSSVARWVRPGGLGGTRQRAVLRFYRGSIEEAMSATLVKVAVTVFWASHADDSSAGLGPTRMRNADDALLISKKRADGSEHPHTTRAACNRHPEPGSDPGSGLAV